jgi:hypothetical protein
MIRGLYPGLYGSVPGPEGLAPVCLFLTPMYRAGSRGHGEPGPGGPGVHGGRDRARERPVPAGP